MVAPLIAAAAFPLGTLATLLLLGGGGGGGGTQPAPQPQPTPPGGVPSPFPVGTSVARVSLSAADCAALSAQNLPCGMNIRTSANPKAAFADGQGTLGGQAQNGELVGVLQQGLTGTDGVEWWKVQNLRGVTGFSRAVDATTKVPSFTMVGTSAGGQSFTPLGGGGAPQPSAQNDQPVDPNAPQQTIAGAPPRWRLQQHLAAQRAAAHRARFAPRPAVYVPSYGSPLIPGLRRYRG